jgi:Synergist-CTERM protein sorting domain-containing protein
MAKTANDTYELTVTLPDDYSGVRRYVVGGFSGDESFRSNVVEVVVKPNLNALSRLNVPDGPLFTFSAGLEYQVAVEGEFSDGTLFDVTNSKLGTTYESDNPSIATVTEDGIVKAITPGKTIVTVRNGDVSALVYLDIIALDIDPESIVEKSALAAKIAEAKELLGNSKVGDEPGQYPQRAYDALESAIADTEVVYNDDGASPDSIAAAEENLQNEIDTFKGSKNGKGDDDDDDDDDDEHTGGGGGNGGGGCSTGFVGLALMFVVPLIVKYRSNKR